MSYQIQEFGSLPDGRLAHLYILKNKQGHIMTFTDLGATWVSALVPDRQGVGKDVVLGYDDLDSYIKNPPYLGAIVGRNANRIAGGKLVLAGKTYQLALNNGPNNLHSGPDYYRLRLWQAKVSQDEQGNHMVTFFLESPHMDQGYPGNASIHVSYTLTESGQVRIDYHMVSDMDTIANLTNHSYFNLAGHDAGDILDQVVWIDADCITDIDESLIPTGQLLPVTNTPMDFTEPKPIGRDLEADFAPLKLAGGYDHNWVLNHQRGQLSLSAWSYHPASGRKLSVYTDMPGIQLYTGNFLEEELPGKGGTCYHRRAGYCFETQYYPNAIQTRSFPSPLLQAGQEFRSTTIYEFTVE